MAKLLYGIGFNSQGEYRATENKRPAKAYNTWRDILRRCYCPTTKEKNKSYKGCSISSEWYDFQNFASWFYKQPNSEESYQLDKDILVKGNKVYGPETCVFVPKEINVMLVDQRRRRGIYPIGVYYWKATDKYDAHISVNGKGKTIGYFDSPDEAYLAYKLAKERYVKNKALEWANRIEWAVFVALMSWEVADYYE